MKTLILYATKYGSAEKCAKLLREKLNGDVEIINIKTAHVPALNDFERVIIGGSIYIGHIQKAIKQFCEQQLETLLKKRVGLFICAGEPDDVSQKELQDAFPAKLYEHAVAREVLGWELYYDRLSWFYKLAIRLVKGAKESHSKLSYENIEKLAKAINA